MGCGCGTSTAPLQPLALTEIEDLKTKGVATAAQMLGRAGLENISFRLGVITTPDGANLYANVFGDAGGINKNWDVIIQVPFGQYSVVIEIRNNSSAKKLSFRTAVSKDGEPNPILEIHFDIEYSNIFPFNVNGHGMLDDFRIVGNKTTLTASCLEECIRRHAPKCVGPCLKDPTGWSCIICAGGAIACCLINCHC